MADSYNSSTSWNDSDITYEHKKADFTIYVLMWIVVGVGLPLNVAALYKTSSLVCKRFRSNDGEAMNTQVRKDHVAAVYFINLLISNLIQLCCMTVLLTVNDVTIVLFLYIFQGFALMTSVYLMLCIALERCSFIISPRCSCFRQVMEIPVVVCFLFWVPSLFWLCRLVYSDLQIKEIILAFLLFLPFPLFILSLGGTLKALCAASRVPPDEKRRTVAIQVLLLLIYTLLFLPFAIWSLTDGYFHSILHYVIFTAVRFIPLANVGVYLFLRKGAADKFLSCVCRCTVDNSEISSRVNDDTVIAVSSV